MDKSRRPKYSPNKCSGRFEKKVIDLRIQTKHRYGAKRLIERYDLKQGKSCVQRIINEHGLKRKPKTKKQKRNELWSIKKLTKVFDKIQIDVKVLTDIPQYWQVYQKEKLPGYEFTARDVKTGASFVCYARKNNSANAATFITYLCEHLKKHGFDIKTMTFQMDNGAEFFACGNKKIGKTPVETLIEDYYKARINRIPPSAPTFNSDVETFHRLVEQEFYDIEVIQNQPDLLQKMYMFLIDFNYCRKNSYKDNRSPIQWAQTDVSNFNIQAFNLTPIVLDDNQHLYFDSIEKPRPEYTPQVITRAQKHDDPYFVESLIGYGWDLLGSSVFKNQDIPQGGYYVSGLHIVQKNNMHKIFNTIKTPDSYWQPEQTPVTGQLIKKC